MVPAVIDRTVSQSVSQTPVTAGHRHGGGREHPDIAAPTPGYCQGGVAHEEGGSYQELATEVGGGSSVLVRPKY